MVKTASDVLCDAMLRIEPGADYGIVVVLISPAESDGSTITVMSNIGDELRSIGALDHAKDAILHPPE